MTDNSIAISLVKSEVENRDREKSGPPKDDYVLVKPGIKDKNHEDTESNSKDVIYFQKIAEFLRNKSIPEGYNTYASILREASSYMVIKNLLICITLSILLLICSYVRMLWVYFEFRLCVLCTTLKPLKKNPNYILYF